MYQSTLERLVTRSSRLRKSRHHGVHHRVALFRAQRMTRHRAGLVHPDHGSVLVNHGDLDFTVRLDSRDHAAARRDFNMIAVDDQVALPRAMAVEPYHA